MSVRMILIGSTTVLALSACGAQNEPVDPVDAAAEEAAAEAMPSPLAAEPTPTAAARAPQTPAIQTGTGPDGSQVELTRARVTGNVLTVEVRYVPIPNTSFFHGYEVADVSVIDDTTSERYAVLQDGQNHWMAAPLSSPSSGRINVRTRNSQPAVVWFKFPAPPATSPTVSITLPEVSPFDGIPVQR